MILANLYIVREGSEHFSRTCSLLYYVLHICRQNDGRR